MSTILSSIPLLRERAMEKLEMELRRCLTPDERMAYQIGYNTGMEAGLEEAKRLVAEYLSSE